MGEEPASDSGNDPDTVRRVAQERRIAREGRQAEHEKRAGWIAAEDVLNAGNPNDLIRALKSGAVDCLFVHPSRWWLQPSTVPEHVWEAAQFKNGKLWRSGICLEGPHQKLVVNEQQWRELGKPAAPAPSADVPPVATHPGADPVEPSTSSVQLRNAPEAEIRGAVQAEYDEAEKAGRKAPNIKEVPALAQARLRAEGFHASQREIARIAEAFKDRRRQPGRTLKSEKGNPVDFALSHTAKSEKSGNHSPDESISSVTIDGDSHEQISGR
jgi:hypothetical protein